MALRNITLKQLRAFLGVVRTGSVTGAAGLLHVSPPAVTLQMQLLQEHAGLPLIERSPAGMAPTEAGREVQRTAERIEAILAECDGALAALAGSERGVVSVGIISTAKYFAPRLLVTFARTNPGIELSLTIGNRAEILAGLSHFSVDIAIMGRPPAELDFLATSIGDHPHIVIAPPDHPLSRQRQIEPSALAAEHWLVREPGSGTLGLMERFFAEAGVTPNIAMQIGSNETIKQAVIAGFGIAFLSGHTVEAEIADGRLGVLDVKGCPVIRQWYVVHLRERRLMPAVQITRRFLVEQARPHLSGQDRRGGEG
ncbi:MAG: LysR family transcriptional regulator [Rhodospirillales bacterium]|nr:LysR family transcriptional regulator [Rhodospirillales bacterium]